MGIAFVSGSASANSGTVSAPSGIVAGNFLLAFVGTFGTAPSLAGWTSLYPYSSSPNCTPLWKIATGSEPSSYAFAGSRNGAAVLQYSGVDPTSPIDSVGFHGTSSGSTSWSCQQAETSAANGLVVSGLYDARGGTTTMPPSGQTLRESDVNIQSIYVWDQAAPSAGWYGGGSGTLAGGGGGTSVWASIPVALRAASVTPSFTATAAQTLPALAQSASGTFTAEAFTITVTPDGPDADIAWDAQAGATSYWIERDGAVVANSITGTSYSDTPGDGEHTYRGGVVL